MKGFPDESQMELSKDGSEPIRGGSIGLNRILNFFVDAASRDRNPQFNAIVISAFTIFRNVFAMKQFPSMTELEEGFVKDVNLFMEYYDTYLSLTWTRLAGDKFCPVIIYFPDYHRVPPEILREKTGQRQLIMDNWKIFLNRHGNHNGEVKTMERTRCFWIQAGQATYPHKEVVRKFKEISVHKDSLYVTGDPVAVITHVPLDLHMSSRLRNMQVLESYTGRLKKPDEFRFRLDKDGNVPFQSVTHVTLGDDVLIKPMITPKIRKAILEAAQRERWVSRSEDDIRAKISKISGIPTTTLRKYDFI